MYIGQFFGHPHRTITHIQIIFALMTDDATDRTYILLRSSWFGGQSYSNEYCTSHNMVTQFLKENF